MHKYQVSTFFKQLNSKYIFNYSTQLLIEEKVVATAGFKMQKSFAKQTEINRDNGYFSIQPPRSCYLFKPFSLYREIKT